MNAFTLVLCKFKNLFEGDDYGLSDVVNSSRCGNLIIKAPYGNIQLILQP